MKRYLCVVFALICGLVTVPAIALEEAAQEHICIAATGQFPSGTYTTEVVVRTITLEFMTPIEVSFAPFGTSLEDPAAELTLDMHRFQVRKFDDLVANIGGEGAGILRFFSETAFHVSCAIVNSSTDRGALRQEMPVMYRFLTDAIDGEIQGVTKNSDFTTNLFLVNNGLNDFPFILTLRGPNGEGEDWDGVAITVPAQSAVSVPDVVARFGIDSIENGAIMINARGDKWSAMGSLVDLGSGDHTALPLHRASWPANDQVPPEVYPPEHPAAINRAFEVSWPPMYDVGGAGMATCLVETQYRWYNVDTMETEMSAWIPLEGADCSVAEPYLFSPSNDEGKYTFRVTATDRNGNTAVGISNAILPKLTVYDTTAPVDGAVTHPPLAYEGMIPVTAHIGIDPNPVNGSGLSRNGGDYLLEVKYSTTADCAGGTWMDAGVREYPFSQTYNVPATTPGCYTFRWTSRDAAGNVAVFESGATTIVAN